MASSCTPASSSPLGCDRRAHVDERTAASFRPEIHIEGCATRVLVEQLDAVDTGRLG